MTNHLLKSNIKYKFIKIINLFLLISALLQGSLVQAQTLPGNVRMDCTTDTSPGWQLDVAGTPILGKDGKKIAIPPVPFNNWFVQPAIAGWHIPPGGRPADFIKPANSLEFTDQNACGFYQWAEQMFLWITSRDSDGKYTFESPIFYGLTASIDGTRDFVANSSKNGLAFSPLIRQFGPHRLPVIFGKNGKMYEFLPGKILKNKEVILDKSGKLIEIAKIGWQQGKAVFFTENRKKIAVDMVANLKDSLRGQWGIRQDFDLKNANIVQRFNSGGGFVFVHANGEVADMALGQATLGGNDKSNVLMAQNGSLVYYSIAVNNMFKEYLNLKQNQKNIAAKDIQFPTTIADIKGLGCPPVFGVKNPATTSECPPDYEALVVEIKTAWVVIPDNELTPKSNWDDYIQIFSEVPVFDKSAVYNESSHQTVTTWTPKKSQKKVKLALVGIHVVGSAKGNPEMIWATFEHDRNAPNATYKYYNQKNLEEEAQPAADANKKWLFNNNAITGPNEMLISIIDEGINKGSLTCSTPICMSNVVRQKAWGAASNVNPKQEQGDPPEKVTPTQSNTAIISINRDVIGKLPDRDVRKNYHLIGATWTKGGAAPDADSTDAPGLNQIGTSRLSNTTMETVLQGHNTEWKGSTNCFSCHKKTKTVCLSHVWDELWNKYKAPQAPPLNCLAGE
jgi:hypothetical protein